MSKEQQYLTPKEQQKLFDKLKESGLLSQEIGQPQNVIDPAAQAGTGAVDYDRIKAMFQDVTTGTQKQEGDKLHPMDAMSQIAGGMFQSSPLPGSELATGPKIKEGKDGTLTVKLPSNHPLLRALGVKSKHDINNPNYYGSAQQANLLKYLPSGLAQMPDGTPFVGQSALTQAIQAKNATGERKSYFMPKGFDPETGKMVSFDAATNKIFLGGEEAPPGSIGRLLSMVAPSLPSGQADSYVLNRTRIGQIDRIFKDFDASQLGPVKGSLEKTLAYYTNQNPQGAKFAKQLDDLLTDLVHDKFGASQTVQELAQRKKAMWSEWQSESSIKGALESYRNKYASSLQYQQEFLNTGGFAGASQLPQPNAAPPAIQPRPPQVSDADLKALNWLKANPLKPQAKKIRAALQAKGLLK